MTINGAITQLVMMTENSMMPNIFRPALNKVIETISELEPEPRKTGEWIEIKYTFHHKCSNCEWINNADSGYNFCPNCGADMRGEQDERNIYTRDNSGNV